MNSPNSPVNLVPGRLAAEAAGTFMLTFAGTATVLAVHQLQTGSTGITTLDDLTIGAAFAFGLIAAVYAVAGLSGAHLNPAITTGLAAVGRFPWRMVPGYVAAQMTGALLAGLANWVIFPHLREPLILGSTHPGPGPRSSWPSPSRAVHSTPPAPWGPTSSRCNSPTGGSTSPGPCWGALPAPHCGSLS